MNNGKKRKDGGAYRRAERLAGLYCGRQKDRSLARRKIHHKKKREAENNEITEICKAGAADRAV